MILAAALLGTAGVAGAEVKLPRSLIAMTPQEVRARVSVSADPLEFETVLTTRAAHRSGPAAAGTVKSDAYLAATIDRRTGAVRYQLRKDIRYAGPRRAFEAVQYLDEGELRRAPLSLARHGADHCPNSDFNQDCFLSKTLAFDLTEPMLRRIAAAGAPAWGFKLKEAGGKDVTGAIVSAEAEGLLLAVADYRRRVQLSAR